jgi:ABC-type cobalamin/Fe3+-siderophores transport system ATPase subunit
VSCPVLRVRDVGWQTGDSCALEHVSFDVAPGEFVAVMGRNGAGKSTLLDVIAGLSSASRGSVIVCDRPLMAWTARERAHLVTHLPQQVRTNRALDAESLVLMGRHGHQTSRWFESDADRAIAEQAMVRCDCIEFRRRELGTLSGGERQRVLLAACLAQNASLLLLDEPASFLDLDQQLHCFGVLREEAERGVACLAVTHDVNLALAFATRLIVLSGRTIAHDSSTTAALENTDWLSLLSRRMAVAVGEAQAPWVQFR